MADQYINSIIGAGSLFRGDLEINGLVRIDGDYIGTIKKASRVLIGNQGRADAVIHARVVVIGGAFQGTVYATERIVVLGTSLVMGALNAPKMLVEPGALMGCSLSIHGVAPAEQDNLNGLKIRNTRVKKEPPRAPIKSPEPAETRGWYK